MTSASDRLRALIQSGKAKKAEAENPNTPSPQELQLRDADPAAVVEAAPTVTPTDAKRTGLAMIGRAYVPELHAQDVAEQKETIAPIAQGVRELGTKADAAASVFADEATRGWATNARAKVKGVPRNEVAAQVKRAETELGPVGAGTIGFAGAVAPYLLAGSLAAPAGLIASAATGAGLGAADVNARSTAETGDWSPAEESILAATFGAGGGVLGNVVGKGMSGLWTRLTAGKGPLPPHMQRSIARESRIIDTAGNAIDDSGVEIKASSLNRLVANIQKQVGTVLTPKGTKKAYGALQRLKSGLTLNPGETLSLRQLNNLRRGIMEINVKPYEQKYINDMVGTLNRYIDALPNAPNAVARGDVKMGVEGWRTMNRHFQDKLKLDKVAEKLAFAEANAKTGNITIDKAIQDQFVKWTNSKAGKKEFENIFTPEERKLLIPITEGNLGTRQLNAIDRAFAKNWFGQAVRLLRTSVAHVPAGTAARRQVSEAFGKLPGGIAPPPMSRPVNQIPQSTGMVLGVDQVEQAQSMMQQGLGGLMNPTGQ